MVHSFVVLLRSISQKQQFFFGPNVYNVITFANHHSVPAVGAFARLGSRFCLSQALLIIVDAQFCVWMF
jgi:hypothetical protein